MQCNRYLRVSQGVVLPFQNCLVFPCPHSFSTFVPCSRNLPTTFPHGQHPPSNKIFSCSYICWNRFMFPCSPKSLGIRTPGNTRRKTSKLRTQNRVREPVNSVRIIWWWVRKSNLVILVVGECSQWRCASTALLWDPHVNLASNLNSFQSNFQKPASFYKFGQQTLKCSWTIGAWG